MTARANHVNTLRFCMAKSKACSYTYRAIAMVHIEDDARAQELPENFSEGWETHRLGSKSEVSDDSGDEHLYNTDHESDFGDYEPVNGRPGGCNTRPLSQRVEKLVLDLREKQEIFKKRRRDIAQSVSRGIRKEFLQQQERLVMRSKQMAKKLQSGRSRAWRHKWVFALVEADFALTAWWLGASPQTFHLYYTVQMAVVMCAKSIWLSHNWAALFPSRLLFFCQCMYISLVMDCSHFGLLVQCSGILLRGTGSLSSSLQEFLRPTWFLLASRMPMSTIHRCCWCSACCGVVPTETNPHNVLA